MKFDENPQQIPIVDIKMNRCFYVCLVLIPLLIGLSLVIFSLTTEYWTRLDFSKIKALKDSGERKGLKLKKVKLEFPKFTSLFGECDEFKLIDIWTPVNGHELELLYNLSTSYGSISNTDSTSTNNNEIKLKQVVYDDMECISREKCNQLNKLINGSCFCCSDQCCLLKSKLCDGVSNCRDRSDESNNCVMRKLYNAVQYYDNKHNCLRHQYNLIEFAKGVFDRNIMGNMVIFKFLPYNSIKILRRI